MPTILLTNDDGISSPGLAVLQDTMKELGQVVVVAPDRDNSAVSHSLTMGRPLRLQNLGGGRYALDGSPADCVIIALSKILVEKPALLVSGINRGANLGDDISYSGTVSAAKEATMYGVPAMAVSMAFADGQPAYQRAKRIIRALAARILAVGLPAGALLNVNFPAGVHSGVRLTRQGRRLWDDPVREIRDPWGETRYWIGGGRIRGEVGGDTDVAAVAAGYVSVTPIHLDATNHQALSALADWRLDDAETFLAG
ncbi:MAG: 5'/3'-nucleotidase SurE [Desulfobulbaceae bacterium]|jgi:5'-nucleotidase|nr:5'/3'-nucleotidase SurE [Desulfobulbaceae bacterium]